MISKEELNNLILQQNAVFQRNFNELANEHVRFYHAYDSGIKHIWFRYITPYAKDQFQCSTCEEFLSKCGNLVAIKSDGSVIPVLFYNTEGCPAIFKDSMKACYERIMSFPAVRSMFMKITEIESIGCAESDGYKHFHLSLDKLPKSPYATYALLKKFNNTMNKTHSSLIKHILHTDRKALAVLKDYLKDNPQEGNTPIWIIIDWIEDLIDKMEKSSWDKECINNILWKFLELHGEDCDIVKSPFGQFSVRPFSQFASLTEDSVASFVQMLLSRHGHKLPTSVKYGAWSIVYDLRNLASMMMESKLTYQEFRAILKKSMNSPYNNSLTTAHKIVAVHGNVDLDFIETFLDKLSQHIELCIDTEPMAESFFAGTDGFMCMRLIITAASQGLDSMVKFFVNKIDTESVSEQTRSFVILYGALMKAFITGITDPEIDQLEKDLKRPILPIKALPHVVLAALKEKC